MTNSKYKDRLKRFITLVEDVNNSDELASKILQENGIEEKAVADQGKVLADQYFGRLAVKKQTGELKTIGRKYWLSAAAAVIFLAFSVWVLVKQNSKNDNQFFIAYYSPYPTIEQTTRSLSNPATNSEDRNEAFRAYSSSNYAYSIKLFNKLLSQGDDEEVLFYLGNAYLSDNKTKEAENTFIHYLSKYREFATEAKWYLSLTYLRQGKTEEAKRLLQELVRQDGDYRKKAEQILREW